MIRPSDEAAYGSAQTKQSTTPNAPLDYPGRTQSFNVPSSGPMVATVPGNPVAGSALSAGIPARYSPQAQPWQMAQQQSDRLRVENRRRLMADRPVTSLLNVVPSGPTSAEQGRTLNRGRAQIARATGTDIGTIIQNVTTPQQAINDMRGITEEGTIPTYVEEERQRIADEEERQRRERLREIFSSIPALRPEQQLAYRTAVRDANREFEMMRNQVQLGRRAARREFRQGVREVGRQQAGGSQDLATALAYLGMDTSPATMGVGLQDLERQADIARAQLAQSRADTMSGLDQQLTQARIGKNRALSQAEQNKLNARAANAAEKLRLQLEYF